MPQPPPKPRQASQPKLQGVTTPDQPERDAVNHVGADGAPRLPPKRAATLPHMAALKAPPLFSTPEEPLPIPPPLPAEHAETVPAPHQDAPTLPAAPEAKQPQVRIESAPASRPGSLPPASHDPRDARLAALERENERLRALKSLPPDKGAWAKLGYRLAAAAVGAAILIITALGARLASNLGEAEDKTAALAKKRKQDKALLTSRDQLWNAWGDRLVEVLRCNQAKQVELNKRQFPEVQRAEPGLWPVYKDSCGEIPERPRELPAPPVDAIEAP